MVKEFQKLLKHHSIFLRKCIFKNHLRKINQTKMNRRKFVQHSIVSLATYSIAHPLMIADKKPGANMKLGLVTYLWGKDWDVPTLIKNCSKTKLGGVELRVEHAHNVHTEMNATERQLVRKQFEDSPVTILGMGTNQAYHYVDQNRLKAEIEGTKDFIRLSHDIGGTGVKVKPNALPSEVNQEKTIEQIGKSLREVAIFGADFGQEIRVEVHGKATSKLPIMKAIMEVADHDNAKVCWNCNDVDIQGEGLEANFEMVKPYFGDTVHIRELNVGEYPYEQLMELFVAMDYQGWILLECRTKPEDHIAAMKEQRKLFKKMIKKGQLALKG